VQIDIDEQNPFRRSIASLDTKSQGDCLMFGVFAGSLRSEDKVEPIYWNPDNNWTSIDYSEELGRIVLGRSDGLVTMLEL
jgi:hypothetical protein